MLWPDSMSVMECLFASLGAVLPAEALRVRFECLRRGWLLLICGVKETPVLMGLTGRSVRLSETGSLCSSRPDS